MNPKSLRKRNSVIQKVTSIHKNHLVSPDRDRIYLICDNYLDSLQFTFEEEKSFYDMVHDNIIVNVSEYLQPKIAANTITLSSAEEVIFGQPFQDVQDRLWSLLDTWVLMYKGPVPALADIADNAQNIHTTDVLKKTTDGVLLLCKVEVPPGQKTLAEFEKEIRRLLTPVKYLSVEEILIYLQSNLDVYRGFPDELKYLLQDNYVEAKPKRLFSGRICISSCDATDEEIQDRIEKIFSTKEVEEEEKVEEIEVEEKVEEVEEVEEVEVEKVEKRFVYFSHGELYGPVYRGDHTKMLQYYIDTFDLPKGSVTMLCENYYLHYDSKIDSINSDLKKTLDDMRDWGNRKFVMKKGENVYKATLRGLWAKIKTYEPEVRDELIKRLYEECHEAVGLCADGHVGRLCNVLVGFDTEFTSSLSPMEYFQNNIALISENIHSTQESKVQQAIELMNSVEMPEGERKVWLDALL
jgi:hypothetical protein